MRWAHVVEIERVEYDEDAIDEHGQPTAGAPVLTTSVANVQPRSRIDELDDPRSAGTEVGDHTIFLPAGTDVRHADTILFDGGRYSITGVRDFRYGGLAHMEVDCRLITSTPTLVAAGSSMPTARSQARVNLNRQAFAELELAHVDGLHEIARKIIDTARPPDAPPYGQGLLQGGGTYAAIGGKKVGGEMQDGRNVKKPRSLRVKAGELVAIAGWGFPGRFVELGTVDTPAEPFLTGAANQVLPGAEVVLGKTIQRRLKGLRDPAAVLRYSGPMQR